MESKLLYCCKVWGLTISPSTLLILEHKQRESLRAITGCVATTNMSALYFNADTLPIASIIEERCIKGYLKDLSYPVTDSRYTAAVAASPKPVIARAHNLTPKFVGTKILEYNPHKQRLKLADKYNLKGLSLENSIMTLPIKPWKTMAANNITVSQHIENRKNIMTKLEPDSNANPERILKNKRRLNFRTIRRVKELSKTYARFDIEIFTDASLKDGIAAGGFSLYQHARRIVGKAKETHKHVDIGINTCSFRAEAITLLNALDYLHDLLKSARHSQSGKRILIATDSQSTLASLSNGPIAQRVPFIAKIWNTLMKISKRFKVYIHLQFIYSHCGFAKNDKADAIATSARIDFQSRIKLNPSVCSKPNKTLAPMWLEDMFNLYIQQRDTETSHQLNIASKFRSTDAEQFYKTLVTRYNRSFMNIKNNLTREQEILLNQVRSGETFLFGKLTRRLGYLTNMTCRHCYPDKHPQRTNRKSLNDYKIQLKTKKEEEDKERLKCPFVNTKDEKRSCKPAKSFATIEALATHCKRAHKMTPNRVTETVRSTDTTTEHNTKQKPSVRFMANNNTEHETNDATANSNTNNAQSNNTTPSAIMNNCKEYTITKKIKCVESLSHMLFVCKAFHHIRLKLDIFKLKNKNIWNALATNQEPIVEYFEEASRLLIW